MVKQFLKERAGQAGGGSRYMPQKDDGPAPSFRLPPKKSVAPGKAETDDNPRARSSRLRVAIRTEADAWQDPVETGADLPSLDQVEASS